MRKLYRSLIQSLEGLILWIHVKKTWIFEWVSVLQKRKLYNHIQWTKEKQEEFDVFWKEHYGKKISNRWHRLYESITGFHNVSYMPDIIFSTKYEPKMNSLAACKILSDKSLVEILFRETGIQFPKTFVLNCDGQFFDGKRNAISVGFALMILENAGEVCIKPTIGSSSGRGVRLLHVEHGKDIKSGELIKDILTQYGKDFIIQERVFQHDEYRKIHPQSLNTLRVVTYLHDDSIHHFPVVLRMGAHGNTVDNIHAGGIYVGVREDGKLHKVAYNDAYEKFEVHPDSNVTFEDYYLPFIGEVINASYNTHKCLPYVNIASWDFIVNPANQVVLIEVNLTGQSIWFPQIAHSAPAFGENTKEILSKLRS